MLGRDANRSAWSAVPVAALGRHRCGLTAEEIASVLSDEASRSPPSSPTANHRGRPNRGSPWRKKKMNASNEAPNKSGTADALFEP
jgi:hypothetical protein